MNNLKKFSFISVFALSLAIVPSVNAEIQCPMGWVKKVENSVVVCVAQDQNQNQAQSQNNNQNQNVNQNVNATGGSSSSSSSSSSHVDIKVENRPAPTSIPHVVYTAPTKVTTLPATGLPEAALALTGGLTAAGFALKRFAFKNNSTEESASSIWLEKNS